MTLRLVPALDRVEAILTLTELIRQGFAGLDAYDETRFVVDAPEPFLTDGENACETLGGHMLITSRLGVKPNHVACLLPHRVRTILSLDEPDAPRLVVALASRRADPVSELMRRAIEDVSSVTRTPQSLH